MVLSFLSLFSASALDIQNLNYNIDNQIISQKGEHQIIFDSITTINPGDSLSLSFPSDFVFDSATIQSDIQVRVNSVLLPITDWNVNRAGQVIFVTFQNTYAAGSDIDITLTSSTDIINPSSSGLYDIDLGINGVFSMTVSVWIFPSEDISVSATVLGEPIIVNGGSNSGGGSSGGSRADICQNCFFNESEPAFDKQGVVLSFKGYGPASGTVQIFVDESFVGTSNIDSNGLFYVSIDNVGKGVHNIKFIGYDINFVQAKEQNLKLSVGVQGYVYANDIFLSPTITVEPRGDYGLVVYGYTLPFAEVDVYIDDNLVGTVVANSRGLYFIETLISQFSVGGHTASSFLKGTTRNLSSSTLSFKVNSIFNSDDVQLEFIQEPLFDVIIGNSIETYRPTKKIPYLPYILAFATGGILVFVIRQFLWHSAHEQGYFISHYGDDSHA